MEVQMYLLNIYIYTCIIYIPIIHNCVSKYKWILWWWERLNPKTFRLQPRDNVPVFSYLSNGDHLSRISVIKRSNRRWFCLRLTQTIKRNMPHWTPKNPLIVLKLRPIPPSAHGVSFNIWQLCHWLSTGCATVLLPPGDRINKQAQRRGMMGSNWVCFRTFDFRI